MVGGIDGVVDAVFEFVHVVGFYLVLRLVRLFEIGDASKVANVESDAIIIRTSLHVYIYNFCQQLTREAELLSFGFFTALVGLDQSWKRDKNHTSLPTAKHALCSALLL